MSTSHSAVMLCGWGVKAGMACLQVKLCAAISARFRKCIWYLKALYECPFTFFTLQGTCGVAMGARVYGRLGDKPFEERQTFWRQ